MISKVFGLRILLVAALLLATAGVAFAAGISGAIFTTDGACTSTNVNIFSSKDAVHLDGGPVKAGAAGLPDGYYYVQVTEPEGTVLGFSNTASVQVLNGEFVQCYQLSAILFTASSSFADAGYDTSTNGGGVYKVWASINPAFPADESKTDNFKVDEENEVTPATLEVIKFYDANANGLNDDGILIDGWKVSIVDGVDYIRYTPVSIQLNPDTYYVNEFMPVEPNWMRTAPATVPVEVTLGPGATEKVEFGNLCVGAGGGKTLGFWSNKNGGSYIGADDLALLQGLNLRNADGSAYDPANVKAFQSWLLSANATNMANMLSAQLAAMALNVYNGFVSGDALIYAPGTTSANALGFATVNAIIAEANASLGTDGLTLAGHPQRTYQEALKNALDYANNNKNFVQAQPCPFTFAE